MMYDWHDGGWGWSWGAWVVMALMMVVFWGAIAATAVLLWQRWRPGPPTPPPGPPPAGEQGAGGRPVADGQAPPPSPATTEPDSALRILEERFARGELGPEEFTERRELLRGR